MQPLLQSSASRPIYVVDCRVLRSGSAPEFLNMVIHGPKSMLPGRQRTAQFLGYFFLEGSGGPLFLLWSVGMGLFLFIFELPKYALAWTGSVALLGCWMMRSERGNSKVRTQLLRSFVEERSNWHTLTDDSSQAIVQKSANVFIEIALKVYSLG